MSKPGFSCPMGRNFSDLFRGAAGFVDKILRGAKPADLPVEQPTKFDLVLNLTTAKVLGLKISSPLSASRRRGDRIAVLFCCGAICRLLALSGHRGLTD